MNSASWQQQIDDTNAGIAARELRRAAIASEKTLVLTDSKKLTALEREELELPSTIEALKRRLPLLNREIEGALKDEAVIRLQELEQAGGAAATEVAASRAAIRLAMQSVLDTITAAHGDWNAYALTAAEMEYLRIRFSLPARQIPPGQKLTPEETHAFVEEFKRRLRRPPNQQPWAGMRADFQESQRRDERQRRAKEDAARPNVPTYTHWNDGKPLAARRN